MDVTLNISSVRFVFPNSEASPKTIARIIFVVGQLDYVVVEGPQALLAMVPY